MAYRRGTELRVALLEAGGDTALAASILRVSRSTVNRWMALEGLSIDRRQYGYIGKKFGRWTITGDAPTRPGRRRFVSVVCSCGTASEVMLKTLKNGDSTSCGCRNREATIARSTKHGMCWTPEYQVWNHMIRRCYDPRVWSYRWYGAKGVSVCDRWRSSFTAFYEDIGPRPSSSHSIDRIDPFGNYEPGNCRWATHKEQMNNQRRHHAA